MCRHAVAVTLCGRTQLSSTLFGGFAVNPMRLRQEAEDGGVAAERERVLSGHAQQDAVCLAKLQKRYGAPGTKVPAPAVARRCVLTDASPCLGAVVKTLQKKNCRVVDWCVGSDDCHLPLTGGN